MRMAETLCVEREGITFLDLMERAGRACSEIIKSETDTCGVLVICGKGKNGGDGFVIARHLEEAGYNVNILLASGKPKAEDAVKMFSLLDPVKTDIAYYIDSVGDVEEYFDEADIIVECVFGTGFKGAADARLSALFDRINTSGKTVYSTDIPAGIDCDSSVTEGACVKADVTIAISALKYAHIMKPAKEMCGRIRVADIGITADEHIGSGSDLISFCDESEVKGILPERPSVSNKGTFGHALNICGSVRMQGAAVLSAKGACRLGAGLVTAAFPEKAYPAVSSKLTGPLLLPLPCDSEGFMAGEASELIKDALNKATAVLADCGTGRTPGTKEVIEKLINGCEAPLVLDADALNIISENPSVLDSAKCNIVITPHPGEMSRLCGKSVEEILENPVKTALLFAKEHNVTVMLKSANTVVCAPGCPVYINSTGNSALAKGGSGDLLAGMTVSLLAQGMSTFAASCAAAYLHGLAADRYTKTHSARMTLPEDLADALPSVLGDF